MWDSDLKNKYKLQHQINILKPDEMDKFEFTIQTSERIKASFKHEIGISICFNSAKGIQSIS